MQAHLCLCCLHAKRDLLPQAKTSDFFVSIVQEKCKHDLISLNLYLVNRALSGHYALALCFLKPGMEILN